MEISAITGSVSIQSPLSQRSAEIISTRVIEARDINGDNRLSAEELGSQSGVLNKVDSNADDFVDQQELFTALAKRLEGKNNATIEISLNIHVIKANLGSLLASILDQADPVDLTGSLSENTNSAENNQVNSDINERYISALITAGIDDGGVFGTTGGLTTSTEVRDSLNSLSTAQTDGRLLLLSLLIEELDTPRDEAALILNVLQNQPFQAVA